MLKLLERQDRMTALPDIIPLNPIIPLLCIVRNNPPSSCVKGIETVTDISDSQVEACAGGPVLRTEVVYFALQKNNKHINRSIQALLQALQQVCRDIAIAVVSHI